MSKPIDARHFSFYNEIKYAFSDAKCSSDFWTTPLGMKRFLKIGDSDQIEPHHVPLIEEKLKLSINIKGDYEYESNNKYPRRITMEYKNDLYTLKVKKKSIQKIYPANATLTTFYKINGKYFVYDGGDEIVIDETMTEAKLRNSKNVMYRKFKMSEMSDKDKETLNGFKNKDDEYEEQLAQFIMKYHDEYIKHIQHLKAISGIDVALSGFSLKQTALNLVSQFWKPYEFQELDKRETDWIFSTKCCALTYFKEECTVQARLVDFNSFYSSLEIYNKNMFPLGNPIYSTLDILPVVLSFGIYRVKISNYDRRLFVHNEKNYYVYTDIKLALKLGFKVELIQDGQPNFLHYAPADRESGDKLFKGYVETLISYKQSNPLVKPLLNILWGSLSEKTKHYSDTTDGEISDDDDIVDVSEKGKELFLIKKRVYKHNTARIGVFLTSYGRCKMADFMEDFIDDVARVHTDGLYITGNKEFIFSNEIGGLKLEKSGVFHFKDLKTITQLE